MTTLARHFDPLRPHRLYAEPDRYEFTHGTESVCVYDIESMAFITEIPVGPEPDCHATSVDNHFLYVACKDGLYCIDQRTLSVARRLDTGHVYGTNVMPDGSTMLLHDAFGGILVVKCIEDMAQIHVHKRIDVLGTNTCMDTLGGKGHFIGDDQYYLCCGWNWPNLYTIEMDEAYTADVFLKNDVMLRKGDDLVVSKDKTKCYAACYNNRIDSYVTVTNLGARRTIKAIRTGRGTCGLTMSNDERYVIASNDADDSISIIDTMFDRLISTVSARTGFERLGISGYIQGISVGQGDEIFVYGCAGNGALVRFSDILENPGWQISYPGGMCSHKDV